MVGLAAMKSADQGMLAMAFFQASAGFLLLAPLLLFYRRFRQEMRQRDRELMALNSIGLTLSQSHDLEGMLASALGQLVELFEVDLGAIYLLDEKTGRLYRRAAVGFRSEYARAFPPTAASPEFLRRLRQARGAVVPGQDLDLPPILRDLEQKEGIIVSRIAGLWWKERVMGAVAVASRTARGFSEAELNLLNAVANQISATIEREMLHGETKRAYENMRRTQEQLLQSEKMAAMGQLISGVAHELNNPLTAILGYGQLLAGSGYTTEPGAEYVEKIYRQALRTHRIVQNLLSFARQRKPEHLPIRLNQIVEDTLTLREYDLRLNNIRVHRDFDAELPPTSGDAHQLQQVFLNILNNAVDVVVEQRHPCEIWVRTFAADSRVAAEFVDSGPGVRDPLRVFDPFYTTKPVGKGTGLGLSICYGIVKEHGGEITVENSAEPGKGAIFRVELPILAVAPGPEPAPESDEEAPLCGSILLVDDEEALLELEAEILRRHCASVFLARSGPEALQVLERENIDVLVTDLKMPGEVSARDLYGWVCRSRGQLARRVVFTTSDARADEARSLLEESGCPFVQKPFPVEDFLGAIRKVVGQTSPEPVRG